MITTDSWYNAHKTWWLWSKHDDLSLNNMLKFKHHIECACVCFQNYWLCPAYFYGEVSFLIMFGMKIFLIFEITHFFRSKTTFKVTAFLLCFNKQLIKTWSSIQYIWYIHIITSGIAKKVIGKLFIATTTYQTLSGVWQSILKIQYH